MSKKRIRVVGCLLFYNNQILLLYRSHTETDPSLWGIPAGKTEAGETDTQAVVREVQEETGLMLDPDSLTFAGELLIEYPELLVEFPVYKSSLKAKEAIVLDPNEHVNYDWLSKQEILALPNLMKDVDKIIEQFA